jgi:hypothetical protein
LRHVNVIERIEMTSKLALILMRAYFIATLVVLAVYFFARARTPLWIDVAFIAWCVVFVFVWNIFRRRKGILISSAEKN